MNRRTFLKSLGVAVAALVTGWRKGEVEPVEVTVTDESFQVHRFRKEILGVAEEFEDYAPLPEEPAELIVSLGNQSIIRYFENPGITEADIANRILELTKQETERAWLEGEPSGEAVGVLGDLGGYIVPPEFVDELLRVANGGEPAMRETVIHGGGISATWDSSKSEIQTLIEVSRKRGIDEETIRQHILEMAVRDLYGVKLDDCHLIPIETNSVLIPTFGSLFGSVYSEVEIEVEQYKDTEFYIGCKEVVSHGEYRFLEPRHFVAYRWGAYTPKA